MANKINKKKLEYIVTEATKSTLNKLRAINESKSVKKMNESLLNETIDMSLKEILNANGINVK